jgi:trigger factor
MGILHPSTLGIVERSRFNTRTHLVQAVESTLETIDPCEVVVTVSVPGAEYKTELDSNFKRLSQTVKMKGFRPGKVPKSVLEKHHGDELRRDTQQQFVQQGLQKLVADEELRPVGQPRMTEESLTDLDDGGFVCKVELSLRPGYELGEYKGLTAESEKVEVTDDEVADAIENVRNQQGRPEPVGDGGLKEDGMAMARLELLNGEDSIMARDGMRLSPQTTPPGVDEEAYKAAMIGAKEGAELEIPVVFPEDFHVEDLRGQAGSCKITIAQAFDMVRPTDEEMMKMIGVDSTEAMNTRVRDDIEKGKQHQVNMKVELALLETLIGNHDMQLPARLLEDQVGNRKNAAAQQMMQEGVPEGEIKGRVEEQDDAMRTEAAHNTKALFLLEDIAQAENLQVQNEDVDQKFQEIAQRNQTSVEEVKKYYQEQNLIQQLAMEILEIKVRTFLRENATITVA